MVAILTRTTGGDLAFAEDVLQQAWLAAFEQWPRDGWPEQPVAWLLRAARNRAIDKIRRSANFERKRHLIEGAGPEGADSLDSAFADDLLDSQLPDERLRLIFTCCHPALNLEAQIALTLRSVCGLNTEEIARAFLTPTATLAQRLVRAQRKIRDAGIPYQVPAQKDLAARSEGVMHVVYLAFTEGYGASGGVDIVRADLCDEAIHLARMLVRSLPADGEIHGLLALMLLQNARRSARADAHGALVLLEDQDRSLWVREDIREGATLIEAGLRRGPPGPYVLQAIIAAIHASAETYADTDWPQIVAIYDLLRRALPSPVVELNRAAALAMRDGPEVGLAELDRITARGELERYHLLPSARAELLRRLKRWEEAGAAYDAALELCTNPREQEFLSRRRASLGM